MNFTDPNSQNFIESLSNLLLNNKIIDENALNRAKTAHSQTNERFDLVLTKLGLVSEEDLNQFLAKLLKIPFVEKNDYPDDLIILNEVSLDFLRLHKILLLDLTQDQLKIATPDPFNHQAFEALSYQLDKDIECCLTRNADFEEAFETLFEHNLSRQTTDYEDLDFLDVNSEDVQKLKDLASEAPVIKLVNDLIIKAVENNASDIHIEPLENYVRVRYRIDGFLNEVQKIPLHLKSAVISRIKILGKLNIAERRLPLDGRIKMTVRGIDVDIRLSTTPIYFGESVVLRILDQSKLTLDFPTLGFEGKTYENYKTLIQKPNGIVLVTGPTGSGKTTTLYASLNELNDVAQKVFTVEDPIEYQLAGINQLQVHSEIGLNFAKALRSILRQDPDIIMVGEIRDLETAQISIQASLTGHLVFSTLHTNSAAATITRLIDMGVEDYFIASTVTGILAQRLVGKLCEHCAEPIEVTQPFIDKLHPTQDTLLMVNHSIKLKKAVGCAYCNYTGFKGRTTIMELLVIDDTIHDVILSSGSQAQIEKQAVQNGMTTMYQNGLVRAFRGETTIEEILRVARLK